MTRRIVETRRRRLALLPRDDNLLTLLLTLLNLKLTFASVSSNYCTRRAVIIQRYNRTFDLPRVPRRRRSKRVSSVGFASEAQRFGSDSGPSIHPSVRQRARADGFSRRCFRPTRFPGPLRIPRSGFAATCGSARPPRASSRPAFSFLHSFDRPQRSLGPDKMPSAASSFILHADAVGGAVGAPPDLANALTARWFADRRTRPPGDSNKSPSRSSSNDDDDVSCADADADADGGGGAPARPCEPLLPTRSPRSSSIPSRGSLASRMSPAPPDAPRLVVRRPTRRDGPSRRSNVVRRVANAAARFTRRAREFPSSFSFRVFLVRCLEAPAPPSLFAPGLEISPLDGPGPAVTLRNSKLGVRRCARATIGPCERAARSIGGRVSR